MSFKSLVEIVIHQSQNLILAREPEQYAESIVILHADRTLSVFCPLLTSALAKCFEQSHFYSVRTAREPTREHIAPHREGPALPSYVFVSLVEKHFPAPDRGRINRLLGLEAPQKLAPHPAPRPALPAARNGADDAHTSKRKRDDSATASEHGGQARARRLVLRRVHPRLRDEAEAESADERRRSDSESDSNPFRAGSGSDSDTEPWMRKKNRSRRRRTRHQEEAFHDSGQDREHVREEKQRRAQPTVTVTAPAGTASPARRSCAQPAAAAVAIERACSMKEELLAAIERLAKRLPPNTLDQLVDELGGTENVAEMTGRKGRVVQTEDGQILYESRSEADVPLETLNLTEKQRFMDGEKDVAIISEAASSGISLQSDRRARNQRRRVHITLELPWSADRAIQQFGRTHRSNQVNAPEYIFLISDLAGERRFASTVAKRLESLGALTHGDRRATETRDLSQFNIDNKYGRTALEAVMKAIMKYETPLVPPPRDYNGDFFQVYYHIAYKTSEICKLNDASGIPLWRDIASALVGVGLIINSESAPGVLSLDKDYNNMSKFLNRILGMPVDLQNRLFKYFTDTLTAVMEQAKRSGRFDLGILDLGSAGECVRRVRCVRYLRRHATGTAPVQLHTVHSEVTKGPPPPGAGQCVRRVRCVRYLRRHATGTAPVQLHTVHSECVRRVRCVRYLRRHATGTAPVQLHTVHSECVRRVRCVRYLRRHATGTAPVQLHTVHSEVTKGPPPPGAGQCVRRVRCVRYLRRHATGTAPVQLHTVHSECVRRVRCVRYLRRHATGTAPVQLHTVHSECVRRVRCVRYLRRHATGTAPVQLHTVHSECVRRVRCVRYLRRHATGTAPVQLHTVHSECVRRVRCVRYLRRHATGTAPVQLHTVHSECVRRVRCVRYLRRHATGTAPVQLHTVHSECVRRVRCVRYLRRHATGTAPVQLHTVHSEVTKGPPPAAGQCVRRVRCVRYLRRHATGTAPVQLHTVHSECVRRVRCVRYLRRHATGTAPVQLHTVHSERGMEWTDALEKHSLLTGPKEGFYLSLTARNNKYTAVLCCATAQPHARAKLTKKEQMYQIYRPNTGLQLRLESLAEIEKKYKRVTAEEAETSWRAQHEASRRVCSHAYWRASCRNAANCEAQTSWRAQHEASRRVCSHAYWRASCRNAANCEAQTSWRAQHEASRRVCSHAYWRASCRNAANCEVGLRLRTYHVLSGSVLAVWARVEGVLAQRSQLNKMQVVRIKTDEGLKIVAFTLCSHSIYCRAKSTASPGRRAGIAGDVSMATSDAKDRQTE
ncbi:hypothetical protein MSG28_005537 [Choristoneura fumiferana]|uniref:Uncharacterized protein n=1 Tax=Choristoneura fumiferana TaxID=7141 RepID=A0ACC0KZE1_CHOFU|nr:hypothetical protein MSG28_005537 [Choristoneura fumiferana]